jgi:hypothetical protein
MSMKLLVSENFSFASSRHGEENEIKVDIRDTVDCSHQDRLLAKRTWHEGGL